MKQPEIHSTTILSVRRGSHVVVAGDGQVTLGNQVVKGGARKVRRLGDGRAVGGFAGSAADGIALFERLDDKLREQRSPLRRAAVELAKEWRTDRALRRLEAMLVVADDQSTFIISGSGDVIEPDDGVCAIGSGGGFALAAARALVRNTDLPARRIAEQAMSIAADICIYTNTSLTIEALGDETGGGDPTGSAGGAGGRAPRGIEALGDETGGGDPTGSAGALKELP